MLELDTEMRNNIKNASSMRIRNMYILTDQYDVGRIYKVINPDDCALSGGSGALMCDDIEDSSTLNRRLDTLYTIVFFISNEEEILTSVKALRSQAVKETFNWFDNEQLEKIKTCMEISKWHLHELENFIK